MISTSPSETQVAIISPNAVLDLIYTKFSRSFSSKVFYQNCSICPGGSGINVARALYGMGISSTIYTILGGSSGDLVKQALIRDGLRAHIIRGDGETRIAVIQYQSGSKTMAVSPTPRFAQDEMDSLIKASKRCLDKAQIIFFGGSFTKNLELQERLVSSLEQYSSRLVIDTRGDILEKFLKLSPLCAKIDVFDNQTHSAEGPKDENWILSHFSSVHNQGISLVCTEGTDQLYAMFEKRIHSYPQFDDPVSRPYGRGDAFMAGILFGILHKMELDQVIRLGVLAGKCLGSYDKGLGSLDTDRFAREKNNLAWLAPRCL